MSKKILSVNGISKKYFIGNKNYDSLSEELSMSARSIFHGKKNNKNQEGIWALNNISFDLYEGDVLGIIGKNGAGKSTLLKIISEITTPTSGTVTYYGRLTSILEIGTGFHPDLTGRENTFLNAAFFGMTKNEVEKKVNNIIAYSGIGDFFDTPVKHYSSGMYLRLAFSIAFHADIEILIVDEVLAVGDAAFRMKSFERIRQLAAEGKTIILASHNLGQISGLCNKCLLLENGKLKSWGAPAKVMTKYTEETISNFQNDNIIGNPTEIIKGNGMLISWENASSMPENNAIKLIRAEVKALGKTVEDPIYVADEIEINFEVEKLTETGKYETGIRISNAEGLQIIVDSFVFRIGNSTYLTNPGTYLISCKIPGGILNFGLYSINLVTTNEGKHPYEFTYLLRFKVSKNPEEAEYYWSNINTLLKVSLKWKVELT